MKQDLVLFTLEYPDPLLDKEIVLLSERFETIYLLPEKIVGAVSLPENVKLVELFKSVDLSNPRRLLVKHAGLVMRVYSWALFHSGQRQSYLKYVRSYLGYLLKEAEKITSLKKFIEDHQLQHALFYDYWLVDATLALSELRRKGMIHQVVSRAHGFDLYHERQFEGQVSFQAYRMKYLDAVYTISRHGYNYLVNQVEPALRNKVKLSYLGTTNSFDGPFKTKNEASKLYTVVSCSSLIPLKRVHLLIDALKVTKLPVQWIHFGDGPLKALLEERAQGMPENVSVNWRGNVSNEEVFSYYRDNYVDLFVSISESEGLPVSMMEAISFGIPILGTDINGVPEIVTDKTGVLIDVNSDHEAVRDALENTLLHSTFDRNEIRQFFRQRFDAQTNISSFIDEVKRI